MTGQDDRETALPVGRSRPAVVEPWTVRNAATLRPDQQAILELVGTTFSRAFGEELSSLLRLPASVVVRPGQQRRWRQLLAELPDPLAAAVVRWGGVEGIGLGAVDLPLAVACIDRLLGGPGQPSHHPHPLTELEHELVSELVRRAATAFASAIGIVVTLAPSVGGDISRLGLIKAAPGDAELVVVELELTAGETSGVLSLALPANDVIPPIDAFIGAGTGGRITPLDPESGLLDAPVDVAARFEPASLTQDELAQLAVGDVITLPHAVGHPLHVFAANVDYLRAAPGRRAGHLAVEIVAPSPGAAL